jgi:hypothetical protein
MASQLAVRGPPERPGNSVVSLRAFHLLFIALSIVLAAFLAAWAVGQYRLGHEAVYLGAGGASLMSAAALAVYAVAFQRKTRNL